MTWHDLLFLHWPVPAQALQALLPPGLELDTFDGRAWLGVVPFRMSGVRLRWLPPLPGSGAFPELNVRTYVKAGGKAGVWFFSLDAASAVAVRAARASFHLPYYDAAMGCTERQGWIEYSSRRTHRDAAAANFRAKYRPSGGQYSARDGTLEHWLTERYCLYSADRRGLLWRGEIHHRPWPLQPAEAEVTENTMARPLGVALPDVPPLAHFARRLDVVAWRLAPVESPA